jgi:ferredoxin
MYIDEDKCIQCGECIQACAIGMISEQDGQIVIDKDCVNSLGCPAATICPQEAILHHDKSSVGGAVMCTVCPVRCEIPPGGTGDCQMLTNKEGQIVRRIGLTPYEDIRQHLKPEFDPVISKPLMTGIGAGTHCINPPAPLIVLENVEGVDVVTSVTECHYLYAGIKVKIDTEKYVGEEGSKVFCEGKEVGMVGKEHYGSKFLELGDVNKFTDGKDGWKAAKLVADIANRKSVKLEVKDGSTLEIQVGQKPIIDGELSERRRYGCGGEVGVSLGKVFLKELFEKGIVNEGIVIDRGYTGRFGIPAMDFNLDPWGKPTMKSGIRIKYVNPVRFCLPHVGGKGWGCTPLKKGFDIILDYDPNRIEPGYTLLITEPSADRIEFYEFTKGKTFKEIPLPNEVEEAIEVFRSECEPARVSAYFIAGAGGTARKGVTKKPVRLSQAVLERKARVTVGGAPAFVYTGGGINFMVDVEEVKPGAFYWTAAPAVVSPLEFTLKLEDYKQIGGFIEDIRPLAEVLKKIVK